MPEFQNVIYEKKGRLAYVTLNRAERRNAIDGQPPRGAARRLHRLQDRRRRLGGHPPRRRRRRLLRRRRPRRHGGILPAAARGWGNAPFAGITRGFECWKPIIAAINGYCLAGGLELALTCDIRVAAEHATFGLPEPKRAIIPGATGTQRLPRAVPLAFAMELMLTGERFDAQTALNFGLVSRVVPADKLMPTAEEIAGEGAGVRAAGRAGDQAGDPPGPRPAVRGGDQAGGRAVRQGDAHGGRPRGADGVRAEAQAGVQG